MSKLEAEFVWLDGKMVPIAEATTPVTAFGLHYGVGVFEGVRCYQRADGRTAIFRLHEHMERFFRSAKIVGLSMSVDADSLAQACVDTVRANRLLQGYIRPIGFAGAGALGMGVQDNPTQVAVIAFPWGPSHGSDSLQNGLRLQISSFVRGHANSLMSKAKVTGQYFASVMAKRESQRLGLDGCLLLDATGRVCEGPGENLFLVRQGRLFTPPLDLPILDGITRDAVLTLARSAGVPVEEAGFTRDWLHAADEIFLTGTAAEVTPVRQIDGRPVGSGVPGPITRLIQGAFFAAAAGPGEPHPGWLTYV